MKRDFDMCVSGIFSVPGFVKWVGIGSVCVCVCLLEFNVLTFARVTSGNLGCSIGCRFIMGSVMTNFN